MKRALLSLALLPILAQAKISVGVGEYRYGPDTPQNIACKMAEEVAKENAITKFLGEDVEFSIFEKCKDEDCEFQKDSLNQVRGYVKQIIHKEVKTVAFQGYTSCIVTIRAEVDSPKNEIKLALDNDFYQFKENQEVSFHGVVNRTGNLVVFNYVNKTFNKIYQETIATNNKEFVLPSPKNRIVARLPVNLNQSKEVLMFLFTENDYDFRNNYTEAEMNYFIKSIPSHQRQIVNRYVYIMRNV
jgi:hypothetical protein